MKKLAKIFDITQTSTEYISVWDPNNKYLQIFDSFQLIFQITCIFAFPVEFASGKIIF
jgi:hypothetical protein